MKKYDDCCIADKGKHFVLTEKGKEWASYKHCTVGQPIDEDDTYASRAMIDRGALIEVDDPEWIIMFGFKVVYYHNGYELCAGNPIVFFNREIAERYKRGWERKSWFNEKLYVVDALYEGKRPKPCREYNGKTVYNRDHWYYDCAEVGDLVEKEIVEYAIECVPPACMRNNCMQCGEPTDHRIDENGKSRATYETFKRVTDDIYEYCGDCFRGENIMKGKQLPYVTG